MPVAYVNMILDTELRLDLPVNDTVIVELKAAEQLYPVYLAQLLTCMKLLKKP